MWCWFQINFQAIRIMFHLQCGIGNFHFGEFFYIFPEEWRGILFAGSLVSIRWTEFSPPFMMLHFFMHSSLCVLVSEFWPIHSTNLYRLKWLCAAHSIYRWYRLWCRQWNVQGHEEQGTTSNWVVSWKLVCNKRKFTAVKSINDRISAHALSLHSAICVSHFVCLFVSLCVCTNL